MPNRQTLHTFYPMFSAKGKLRVHYSLPQPQKELEEFHLPPGSVSHKQAPPPGQGHCQAGLRAAPGHSWNCLKNMGREKGTAVPFSQLHLFILLQVQGRRGQLSLSDQKKAINEKPGEEQPCKLSCASSGRGAAGPSHPLLPAPLTKKTLLLLQFRQLNWTSEVRWYK